MANMPGIAAMQADGVLHAERGPGRAAVIVKVQAGPSRVWAMDVTA
ncbi:hypothetical protein [Novosphingobium humi]|uniref:Uncharacterized protein n=1 Tax=Novosphingobium humi TaxID=2282397 RepID=A0ABY7U0L7_9SPHN|nr:hypothetical protein [Novosphingobium humi]WCT79069.1 hypothetical protein PQ457_01920 [Novosphingobium humi]